MKTVSRRMLLQMVTGAVAPGFVLAQPTAPAATAPSAAASGAAGVALTPPEWMDQWIGRWKTSGRDVEGLLYLGRFADPVYFLTKIISWKPNANQKGMYPQVTVPVGFVTDFASIPRPFWSMLRPDGDYAYAAVIHDYLYWTQSFSREKSDMIFKLAMEDFKIGSAEVGAIYAGVRAGGQIPWNENAKLKKRGEKRVLKVNPTDPTTKWDQYKQRPGVFAK
jgi:hypothetical protein